MRNKAVKEMSRCENKSMVNKDHMPIPKAPQSIHHDQIIRQWSYKNHCSFSPHIIKTNSSMMNE